MQYKLDLDAPTEITKWMEKMAFTLPWTDTHVCVNSDGDTIRAFTFAGCVMTRSKQPSFPFFIITFFSPDGKKFETEKLLIKYMDKKNGTV